MHEFAPGEAKMAVAPITVSPSGLACQAEVFLGPDEMTKVVTSGLVPFTSTGVSQDVSLPVTMPSAEGSYHVYIDVYAEGILIAAYQAIEDVIITPPIADEITFQSMSYPVYPCYKGNTTAEMLLYIPASACPVGSELYVTVIIPYDSDALPRYDPRYPDRYYSIDWYLMTATLHNEDLTSPDGLYTMPTRSPGRELSIRRYLSGWHVYDFLPAGSYPLYLWVRLDGVEISKTYIGDMVITSQVLSNFGYSNLEAYDTPAGNRREIHFSATVTNNGPNTETHYVRIFNRHWSRPWSWTPRAGAILTLSPGQSGIVRDDQLASESYYFKVIDDQGAESSTFRYSL